MNTSSFNQLLFRASPGTSVSRNAPTKDRIALYDWYGPLAYGVILQIVPQPELAQQVLVDLFSSDELPFAADSSASQSAALIRLARRQALAVSAAPNAPAGPRTASRPITDESLPELVFDLTFRRGQQLRTVADRLQMTYEDISRALRTYVHSFRNR